MTISTANKRGYACGDLKLAASAGYVIVSNKGRMHVKDSA